MNLEQKCNEISIQPVEIGNEKVTPTKITFYANEALDTVYLWDICSLLEEHGYNSNNLRLNSEDLGFQTFAHRENGQIVIDRQKRKMKYSLECDNLDEKTKSEIEKMLEDVPYVKLSSDF